MCPSLQGLSQSSPSGCFCLGVSWCSSQLACHVSKHAPRRAEYAQTCLSDFRNCTVASLSHLAKQVLVRKAVWISVCAHAGVHACFCLCCTFNYMRWWSHCCCSAGSAVSQEVLWPSVQQKLRVSLQHWVLTGWLQRAYDSFWMQRGGQMVLIVS